MNRNPYEILDVGTGATADEIKKSFDEKSQALSQLEIPGSYSGRLMLANGDMLLATTKYSYVKNESVTVTRITRITAMNSSLSEVAHQEWQTKYSQNDPSFPCAFSTEPGPPASWFFGNRR